MQCRSSMLRHRLPLTRHSTRSQGLEPLTPNIRGTSPVAEDYTGSFRPAVDRCRDGVRYSLHTRGMLEGTLLLRWRWWVSVMGKLGI